jgi:predicted CoA-binding protein
MDQTTREFLQARRLAVVGVSRTANKFGNAIYTELKARGFEVYGVNPNLKTIAGDQRHASLYDLAGKVDAVVVCLSPQQAPDVIRQAAATGIEKIWLQQGSQSPEAVRVARELGITPVAGKCILMYAGEVKSVHAFHRFFARLFGQY